MNQLYASLARGVPDNSVSNDGTVEIDKSFYYQIGVAFVCYGIVVIGSLTSDASHLVGTAIETAVYSERFHNVLELSTFVCVPIVINYFLDVIWFAWKVYNHRQPFETNIVESRDLITKSMVILGLVLPSVVLLPMPNLPNKVVQYILQTISQNFLILCGVFVTTSSKSNKLWTPSRTLMISTSYSISQVLLFYQTCFGLKSIIYNIAYEASLYIAGIIFIMLVVAEIQMFLCDIFRGPMSKDALLSMSYHFTILVAFILSIVTSSVLHTGALIDTNNYSITCYTYISIIVALMLTILPSRISAFEAAYSMGLLRGERNQIIKQLSPSLRILIVEIERLIESSNQFDVETYNIISKMTFACQRALQSLHTIVYGEQPNSDTPMHSNAALHMNNCMYGENDSFSQLGSSLVCDHRVDDLNSCSNHQENGNSEQPVPMTTTTNSNSTIKVYDAIKRSSKSSGVESHMMSTDSEGFEISKSMFERIDDDMSSMTLSAHNDMEGDNINFGVTEDALVDNHVHGGHKSPSMSATVIQKELLELVVSLQSNLDHIEAKGNNGKHEASNNKYVYPDVESGCGNLMMDHSMHSMHSIHHSMQSMHSMDNVGIELYIRMQKSLLGFVAVVNSSVHWFCSVSQYEALGTPGLQGELLGLRATLKSLEVAVVALCSHLDHKSCDHADISNFSE